MAKRMNISLPSDLKARMDTARRDVNWSEVAQRAFETKLGEVAEKKLEKTMRVCPGSALTSLLMGAVLLLCLSVVAIAQGRLVQPPQKTNSTVVFAVSSKNGITGTDVRACLTVAKTGLTTLVNGPAGQGKIDGRHNFPAGSNSNGIGQYYRGLLLNAGWHEPTDFNVSGSQINFYDISGVDGGASSAQIHVNGSTDSTTIQFVPIPKRKILKFARDGAVQDGCVTLVAFGILWDFQNSQLTTSTSSVTVFFTAEDSASEVLTNICQALEDHGWTAQMNGDTLEITRNSHGAYIYSLWHSIKYDEEGENDDHWTFFDGS